MRSKNKKKRAQEFGSFPVFEAVMEERAFQDAKWGSIKNNPHDKGTWWILIQAELEEARQALVKGGHGRNSFESELVQTAALCFAALEQHGLPVEPRGGRGIDKRTHTEG